MSSGEIHSLSRLHNSGDHPTDLPGAASYAAIPPDSTLSAHTGGAPRVEVRGLHLLVMSADSFSTIPLPATGEVIIGRSSRAYVRIDDPRASRNHARLVLGDAIAIEDLGSANGTRVRDNLVAPGKPIEIHPGEGIGIGSTVLMVQQNRADLYPRRLWSHGYFENRVEEECVRAGATGGGFALVRLRLECPQPWMRVLPALAKNLPQPHMLAFYGPHDYEVLMVEMTAAAVAEMCDSLLAALREAGCPARAGVGLYPRDGRSADALLAHANASLKAQAALRPAEVVQLSPRIESAMQRITALAARAATSGINVLILGETGVGKEVLAQTIHRDSPRAGKKFLGLNCAGLTESLIESELFGHEKGAFTGATSSKPGLLEAAGGGTVLLDEVGEMPLTLQAKLLRVIETREVVPVGGVKPRLIDVRFVAATNRDLESEVLKGTFRRDLFYRLNGLTLSIPPLRERLGELPGLVEIFLAEASQELGRPCPRVTAEAMGWLSRYRWPGNIRELKNVMERALVLCDGDVIDLTHLPAEKLRAAPTLIPSARVQPAQAAPVAEVLVAGPAMPAPPPLDPARAAERDRILQALESCAWNQSRAADLLNMPRRTFVTRLDAYGIPRPQKGPQKE